MSRFRITPSAYDDLFQIVDFLLPQSQSAARHVFDSLMAAIRRIGRNPGIGHERDDIADETLRFLPVFSYLIVYRETDSGVEIIRVLHGARDLRSIFESEA